MGSAAHMQLDDWRTQVERLLLAAQADTYSRALGSRAAERPAAEHPSAVGRVARAFFFFLIGGASTCDSHVKVRQTETETETEAETETEVWCIASACHSLGVFLSFFCAPDC